MTSNLNINLNNLEDLHKIRTTATDKKTMEKTYWQLTIFLAVFFFKKMKV